MTWLITIGLTNAVLATPLAVLAWAVGRSSRRPALSHLLWVLVLVKLLTPPLIEIPVPWQIDPSIWLAQAPSAGTPASVGDVGVPALAGSVLPSDKSTLTPTSSPPVSQSTSIAAPRDNAPAKAGTPAMSPTSPAIRWRLAVSPALCFRVAMAIWLTGAGGTVLLLVVRALRFRRFLKLAGRSDARLKERVTQLARAVGLSRAVEVVVVESVVSPMLWGVGRGARLVFPAPLAQRLDSGACDSLLLHELAHYARGDHWIRLVELAAQVLFWWHPVVWWARREIEASEEQCCDAWVIEHQAGSRRSYAEALLATIDFLCDQPAPLPPAACGLGDVPLLRCRLTQIMRGDVAARLSPAAKALALGAALVILPWGPALFAASSRPATLIDSPRPIVVEIEHPPARLDGRAVADADLGPAGDSSAGRLAPASAAAKSTSADPPRAPSELWATATSANGKYRLEVRTGFKTTLVNLETDFRLDLTSHQIRCVAFAPDGRTFATGHEDRVVRIWDSQTGGVLHSLKGSDGAITSVDVSPDGQHVAAGAADGRVLVWDLTTLDESARLPQQDAKVKCVRWSGRGDHLAVILGDWNDEVHAAFLVWSPAESVVLTRQPLAKPAGALDWLADDKALLIATWDGQGRIWNLATEEPATEEWQLGKDLVDAAGWSPDCPLVSRWLADRLVTGAE